MSYQTNNYVYVRPHLFSNETLPVRKYDPIETNRWIHQSVQKCTPTERKCSGVVMLFLISGVVLDIIGLFMMVDNNPEGSDKPAFQAGIGLFTIGALITLINCIAAGCLCKKAFH